MKFLLKIFTIFSSIFFLSGCFAKYETPPIAKKVDLQKVGVVAEFDLSVTDRDYYDFFLNYVYDREQYAKELAELEKQYSNTHRSDLPETNTQKIIDKFVGIFDEDKKGSKIVLKLTVTPLFDIEKEYLKFESYKTEGRIVEKKGSLTIFVENPKKPPFKKTIDLSQVKGEYTGSNFGYDNKKYGAREKNIYSIWLPKGDYHIKLESLEDVPEINEIKTTFSIYINRHKV